MNVLFSNRDEDGRLRPIFRFVLAVMVTYFAVLGATVLMDLFSGVHERFNDMLLRLFGMLLLAGAYGLLARYADESEQPLAYIGLPFNRRAAVHAMWGFGITAGMMTLIFAIIATFGDISLRITLDAKNGERAVVVIIALITGGMAEELVFRGYPFHRLAEAIGIPAALVVLSFVFGYLHLQNPNAGGLLSWGMLCTVLAGILFAYAYLRTRSLWLPFGMHLGWNFFMGVVYGLPVSGISAFAVITHARTKGPVLLTGGAYGPEASLTGAIVLGIGFFLVRLVPAARMPSFESEPTSQASGGSQSI